MLTQNVYSVGTATTTVVAPTLDSARYVLKNLEPANTIGEFSRVGYMYAISRYFSVANNSSVSFSFTTGALGAQFDYWQFDSSSSSVIAELIEGATITKTGSPIQAYNLNRNKADTPQSVAYAASALTGGTVVYTNYVGASNQAAGGASSNSVITLEPNTEYGFRFRDVGGNGTNVNALIGWVEKFNGLNEIWLGSVDNSFVLSGGEEVSMYLRPYETINATALRDGCRLAVMRQD